MITSFNGQCLKKRCTIFLYICGEIGTVFMKGKIKGFKKIYIVSLVV